ncbi:MAG: PHP domain-containing protein [Bacilli bacterium]|nr:PHP domain-containing protein [Bacilli bacterium]
MVDIHSHTTYFDGSSSVDELLSEAQKLNLSLLSITDHNTIQAHFELQNSNIRDRFKGEIISGIEITTTYKGETIEVLGYGFDLETMQKFLDANVLSFGQKQIKEYDLIKNRYNAIGVIFDENNIKFDPKVESCRPAFAIEIKKHPENYKFFLNQESINTASGFTRNEVYNPKSPLYVDESSLFPSLETAIQMIHNSGGLAFLAHTFAYSPNIANELLNIINNYELDGLECFYTTFTKEQSDYLVSVCNDRKLYMSGGSDFHGTRKINHNLGTGQGNLHIDESVVDNWVSDYISSFDSVKNIK